MKRMMLKLGSAVAACLLAPCHLANVALTTICAALAKWEASLSTAMSSAASPNGHGVGDTRAGRWIKISVSTVHPIPGRRSWRGFGRRELGQIR